MRKFISAVLICATAICTAVMMSSCGTSQTLDIDLNDYIEFRFSGVDGEGTVEFLFDDNVFREEYGEDIVLKDSKGGDESAADVFLDYMDSCGSFDTNGNLTNGDSVLFSWNLDELILEDRFNVVLNYKDIDLTVEGLKDPYVDITDFKCDKDAKVLYLNSGEDILFTVNVDSNIDIDGSVCLAMSDVGDEFMVFGMNDNGEEGDEKAGDGIYSVCLTNAIDTPGVRIFYVDVNGVQSDTVVNIIFEEDPAAEREESKVSEEPEDNTDVETAAVTVESEDSVGGNKNAAEAAKSYAEDSAISYNELISRLENDGYTSEEAAFGADYCDADWDDHALKRAQQYLDAAAYSYSALKEQLENNGFTSEQALYGVNNCGADWYDQAFLRACEYMNTDDFDSRRLVGQLEYEGFTSDEAEYGAEQAEACM